MNADTLFHIASFLNQKDFASLKEVIGRKLSSKDKKDLFYNVIAFHKISKAGNLLKATEYADYEVAQKLIKNNPSLMFEPISFRFRDGSEERISPLRYAFKVYDTYMWKTVFLKTIEQLNRTEEKTEYLKEFLAQMQAQHQVGHIDLEILFQAYEHYNRQYDLRNEISSKAIIDGWFELAKQQKGLPVHMLKEFSRRSNQGDTWAEAEFKIDERPWPSDCHVFVAHDQKKSLYSTLLSSLAFIFVRNEGGYPCLLRPYHWQNINTDSSTASLLSLEYDLQRFRRLLEKRKDDFTMQLENMKSLLSRPNPKQAEDKLDKLRTW